MTADDTARYAVVGCSSCDHRLIIERAGAVAETATCPRCQAIFQRDGRRPLAEADTKAAIEAAYAELNRGFWS